MGVCWYGLDAAKECDRLPSKSVAAYEINSGREIKKAFKPEKHHTKNNPLI
jgi:hypothetical protein